MSDAKSLCRGALLALAASALLLVSTNAVAGLCKANGQVCSTLQSCCSRNCAKAITKKATALFGLCCAPGQRLFNGTCCTPVTSCAAGACGTVSDGCGGTHNCGGCDATECLTCMSNACVSACASDEVCEQGICETTTTTTTTTTSTTTTTMGCVPSCAAAFACGDDGCGGTCGTCYAPAVCQTSGTCSDPCTDGTLPPGGLDGGLAHVFGSVDGVQVTPSPATVDECCRACIANAACVQWVFVPPTQVCLLDTNSQTCSNVLQVPQSPIEAADVRCPQ